MRTKTLLVLAAVTLVALAAAAWSVYERQQETAVAALPEALFPGLADAVNEVEAIEVTTPEQRFTIARAEQGDGWVLVEKGGYPVKAETVKQALLGIAQLRPIAAKTAEPTLYHRLQVVAPDPEEVREGEGLLLRLLAADDREAAAVILGKTKSTPSGSREGWYYVRKPEEPRSWLASSRIEAPRQAAKWADQEMVEVARSRIRMARTVQPTGEKLTVQRESPEKTDFSVQNLPEGANAKTGTAANALGSALGFLTFEDVRPAGEVSFETAGRTLYRTFDGLAVTATVQPDGQEAWVRFEAAYDPEARMVESLPEKAREGLKAADEVKAEAARINQRFGPWAYRVSQYKAKDLTTRMEDVVTYEAAAKRDGGS